MMPSFHLFGDHTSVSCLQGTSYSLNLILGLKVVKQICAYLTKHRHPPTPRNRRYLGGSHG
jgi:hypothetical protein